MQTHGSWSNYSEVLRRVPAARERLEDLAGNAALLDTGLFSREGIADVILEHLSGSRSHVKLLMQLLTLASWFGGHQTQVIDHEN